MELLEDKTNKLISYKRKILVGKPGHILAGEKIFPRVRAVQQTQYMHKRRFS